MKGVTKKAPHIPVHSAAGAALLVVAGLMMAMLASPVQAQVHHVVGGDVGWDPSINIASWAAGKIFRVGDIIWFAYSAAWDSIVELRTKEEYESCDLTNPIRTYTDGIDAVFLEEEGERYFTSSSLEMCKAGLRLPVAVQAPGQGQPLAVPMIAASQAEAHAAAGPTSPSGSHSHRTAAGPSTLWLSLFLVGLCHWAL